MERTDALSRLPDSYARALELRDEGRADEEIAAELDIVPEAVGTMLRLAEAKLAHLINPASTQS